MSRTNAAFTPNKVAVSSSPAASVKEESHGQQQIDGAELYIEAAPTTVRARTPLSSTVATASTLQPGLSYYPIHINSGDDAARSFEMRLMYHYTKHACFAMPECAGETSRELWEYKIPQLAFKSDIVLNALLASAALHLESLTPNDRHVSSAASSYISKAMMKHRTTLVRVDGETTEPIFITGALISNATWLLSHRRVSHEPYSLPIKAYGMMRGCTYLFLQDRHRLEKAGYHWYSSETLSPITENVKIDSLSSPLLTSLDEDFGLVTQNFRIHSFSMSSELSDVYEEAMQYIRWLYSCLVSPEPPGDGEYLQRFCVSMPVRVDQKFVELLSQEDPLAMGLLARNMALLKFLPYTWWLHGAGEYEVLGYSLSGICGLMPEPYKWLMNWPLNVVAGNIHLRDGLVD